jgi:hypothetical protein
VEKMDCDILSLYYLESDNDIPILKRIFVTRKTESLFAFFIKGKNDLLTCFWGGEKEKVQHLGFIT